MTNNSDPILDDLTAPQRKAVSYGDGPLLVVAGAGSGKTRVITRRIAHLVRQGTPPERIVGITFTNKAAQEMRLRVESLVGEAVTVKTFHSLCALILRHNAEHLGLDPGYSIYDRSDSQRVVRQIRKDLNLDPDTFKPSDLLDNISAWKDDVLSPSDAQLEAIGNFEEKAAEVYNIYEQRLKANNALDFDDLLVKTVRLFSQSPEVLRQYQNRYLHVLVDEYQDTNLPQHLIAKGLQGKHKNITAVGDPDQMIYTWRGARIENIMEFEDDFPGAEVIMLEQNYRSTANILRAASECIQNNRMRHEKALWTERDGGHPVRIREFPTGRGEARWIAAKMEELLDEGVDPGEIAVLYRTKYQAFQLEKELVNSPVPYQVVDTVGFFDRKPVKDLRAYLRLIINPDDDEAFRRIVNVPSRGIGAKTVERLERIADKYGESLCRVLHHEKCLDELPTRASKAVATFRDLYHKLTALSQDTIGDFVESLIGEIQYIDSAREDDKENVQEVLNHFMGFAREYDSNHEDGSLLDFMEQTALMSDVDGWDAQADTASLMTLHSAKGLEFDCVFLCGLEQNILPHQRALENNPHGDAEYGEEEERRLFHVGMTRARKELFITHCQSRYMHGEERQQRPSPFLNELPSKGVDRERCSGSGKSNLFQHQIQQARRQKGRSGSRKIKRSGNRSSSQSQQTTGTASAISGSDSPLQLVNEGDEMAPGARVKHSSYGDGEVVKIESAGKYKQVRVDFGDRGVLNIILT